MKSKMMDHLNLKNFKRNLDESHKKTAEGKISFMTIGLISAFKLNLNLMSKCNMRKRMKLSRCLNNWIKALNEIIQRLRLKMKE